jgi:HK97 family phage prohead protease
MLYGGVAHGGALELRQQKNGGVQITGRFPYGTETMLAKGRFEQFAARAFADKIAGAGDVHFLVQHDYAQPLASRSAGTLELRDSAQALEFTATITPEMASTTWARDFLSANAAGLVRGLSPGFVVAPGGDTVERRGDGVLRTVTAADLFELSAVTVPAYPAAQIEARNWQVHQDHRPVLGAVYAHNRWRV